MTDLDERIRNVIAELVSSAPRPPDFPEGPRRRSSPRIAMVAAVVGALMLVALVGSYWLDHQRGHSGSVSTVTAPKALDLSALRAEMIQQLEGSDTPNLASVPAGVAEGPLKVVEVKETTWSTFLDASAFLNGGSVSGVGAPTASQPVLVEIAIGDFASAEEPRSSSSMIAVRETTAPYLPLAVTWSHDTSLPRWFTALPTVR